MFTAHLKVHAKILNIKKSFNYTVLFCCVRLPEILSRAPHSVAFRGVNQFYCFVFLYRLLLCMNKTMIVLLVTWDKILGPDFASSFM